MTVSSTSNILSTIFEGVSRCRHMALACQLFQFSLVEDKKKKKYKPNFPNHFSSNILESTSVHLNLLYGNCAFPFPCHDQVQFELLSLLWHNLQNNLKAIIFYNILAYVSLFSMMSLAVMKSSDAIALKGNVWKTIPKWLLCSIIIYELAMGMLQTDYIRCWLHWYFFNDE